MPALPNDVAQRISTGDIDVVAFASSSTVRNLVALADGTLPSSVRGASIGPATSATCAELGIAVHAEADPSDVDGLAAAVVQAWVSRG